MRIPVLRTTILFILSLLFIIPAHSEEVKQSESYMNVYSDGQKVGYTHIVIETSGMYTLVKERSEINITLIGKDQKVSTHAVYELNDNVLNSYKYTMKSDTGEIASEGVLQDGRLNITYESLSGKTELTLDSTNEFTIFALLPRWLSERPMRVGEEYFVPLFEPATVLMGVSARDLVSSSKVEGTELIETQESGPIKTFKVRTNFLGSEYVSWISEDGEVIKQTMPPGLTASRKSSKNGDREKTKSFDITEKTSIRSDVKIKDPRDVEYLKVEVEGLEDTGGMSINDEYRQKYHNDIIEISSLNKVDSAAYELPYSKGAHESYLSPSYLIQSEDELIKSQAREIIEDERDPAKAAETINSWVFKNLKKEGTVSLPNALDVLKTKKGDCNEHAALFAALARAAGIPTKLVMGTIYIDGRFYYHAWNEVYLGRWVAVDSTYGQLPADATHIKLIEGDIKKSAEIMKVVGKIKIKVLEAS